MNRHVLVIDDSDTIHKLIGAVLAKEQVQLHSAHDARHGLVLAASLVPDLILLDVDMPGLNGFQTAERLRADPATADCPVIFLTAHDTPGEKVQGFGLGAVDYVTKPFNAAELCVRVRRSLATTRTIRSLKAQSMTDAATGLGNRQMFDARLDAEVNLHARTGNPLCVLAVQAANFDDVADGFGPRTAAQAFGHLGKLIGEMCRAEDVACRLEGPNFAVLMPNTSVADARVLAERVRDKIARTAFKPATASSLAESPVRLLIRTGAAGSLEAFDRSMLDRARETMSHTAARAA